jgi:putative SOS response-associated peptidase YedK
MPAGEPMRQIHDRQPVILDPTVYDTWLNPKTPVNAARGLLLANLDGEVQFHRVGRAVNSIKNQGGECIEPINPL